MSVNPLLAPWTAPHALPPYALTTPEHFGPAMDAALAEASAEIEAIATSTAAPTFENTIVAMEKGGKLFSRIAMMFYGLCGTDTTPALQALERAFAPKLTAHRMKIAQDPRLFARVDAIDKAKATLGLTGEQLQVLERSMRGFVRAGARLDGAGKARLKANAERASVLATQFNQNVLKDEQSWSLMLRETADLAGLDEDVIATAKASAEAKGETKAWAITLSRSSIVPFLEQSTRRDLREIAYKAWVARGANGGESDNKKILAEMMALRAEQATLLGHATYADMGLEFTMAKTPKAVLGLLDEVWKPARAAAHAERDMLLVEAAKDGHKGPIAAWDWRHYAERVRKAKFDLDESELRPYLQLERMIDAAFDCATRLFGLTFKALGGVTLNNPETRAWEVFRKDGSLVGVFTGDYFLRPSKRSGAWMSALRGQHRLGDAGDGKVLPIITNTCNFAKPAPGKPALISLDDARTLFHEFGHALHGLLSDVTYPSVAGTAVARDFVELPSQLYEHWLTTPHVLENFATHVETGKPMPEDLVRRMKAARNFNMGFSTVEFLASAYVDMDLHTRGGNAAKDIDIDAAERACLDRIGMPAEIGMRHRPTHFQHIMGGYAAGYYSYLWSEVLDADAFKAFEDSGNVFDPTVAKRLHDHVYSAGGKQEPDAAYIAFRGALPDTSALLAKRGFPSEAA
jgi:peptidyl-dipeptidase Dcp